MREDSQPGVSCEKCGRRYLLSTSCDPCPYCENERLRKLLFYLADSVAAYRSCGTATNALRLAANLDAAIDAAKKELLI